MKRKPKLPALLLAAVLLLSLLSALTGCHGNEPPPRPGNSPAPTGGTTAAPAPDDFVYQTEYIPVAEEIGSFSRMACGNGGFLCACWEKTGDPEGEAPESGSRDEVYAMKLYFIGLDGSVLSLERYRPLETGEGDTTYIVSLAICAESENKEAAWRFLRTVLTAAYQEQYATELPLNRLAFEAKLRGAMTPEYQTAADGSYLLDENGERIERDKATFVWGGQEIHIRAMTQEQADQLMELIETTTKVLISDEEIITMIANEAEAYFYGQKTAEEVGRLLQSKITIYLSEQK